jgi:hypothetical protein
LADRLEVVVATTWRRAERTIDAADPGGMMAFMPTSTASRRALVATALGLSLPLSLAAFVGISQMADARREEVGCSLLWINGYLVADNGQVALVKSSIGNVSLDWPDGWTVRRTYDGQLEIVEGMGTVRARTGEGIVLMGVSDPDGSGPWIRDGELVVCPFQWPINYMDPDYVAPGGDAP